MSSRSCIIVSYFISYLSTIVLPTIELYSWPLQDILFDRLPLEQCPDFTAIQTCAVPRESLAMIFLKVHDLEDQ
jgi:hypothetical protein